MSQPSPSSLLSEIERQRLSVYVRTRGRPTPGWFWLGLGLGSALLLAVNELGSVPLSLLAVMGFAGFIGWSVARAREEAGVQPRLGGMPWPLRRILFIYWGLAAAVLGSGAFALAFLHDGAFSWVAFGILAGLVTGLGGWVASRRYEARAQALAREAGIRP
jgi:hypothetical protein